MSQNNEVYILGSARIPFAKSQTVYANVSRKQLMEVALNALVNQYHLKNQLMGDIALGAVINSVADFNLARECLLSTELHPDTPAYNVQRACGTGLETTWQIALKIYTGAIDMGIAGGVDSNSDVPIEVSAPLKSALMNLYRAKSITEKISIIARLSFKDLKPSIPTVNEPRTLLSMGEHCELMVKEWNISRQEQDELALASHLNAAKAYATGFFDALVHPFMNIKQDATLRADTTLEKLAKLKPVFDLQTGSLTAGNSSPLTDGAACLLIANQQGAEKLGLKPLVKIIDVQVAAVNFVKGAGLLMAPTKAVAQLFARNKLGFDDFDYIEIHEAFAGQVLCNLKAWETPSYCKEVLGLDAALGTVDRSKLNVVGSSLSVGHPFAATGARIAGTLAKLIHQNGRKRGLISICTAGGMGIAAILEAI
ncbi:acetyl-CoA C-acetyltransferase [Candidatus Berkiella cookevillensis]|uniref:acetyl-CoA C-acetyltransferase n=1 Tax=Candidatus Berkiella cookevillensis TaxID=437022 RepID=UPI00070C6F8B